MKRARMPPPYKILDTDPEQAFDDFTRLAAHLWNPIALVSLIDESRQWFKSKWDWMQRKHPVMCLAPMRLQPNEVLIVPHPDRL